MLNEKKVNPFTIFVLLLVEYLVGAMIIVEIVASLVSYQDYVSKLIKSLAIELPLVLVASTLIVKGESGICNKTLKITWLAALWFAIAFLGMEKVGLTMMGTFVIYGVAEFMVYWRIEQKYVHPLFPKDFVVTVLTALAGVGFMFFYVYGRPIYSETIVFIAMLISTAISLIGLKKDSFYYVFNLVGFLSVLVWMLLVPLFAMVIIIVMVLVDTMMTLCEPISKFNPSWLKLE